MSLRKTAGLLVVAGLIVGLLGSGVGASFFASVTGTENIDVGSFSCRIVPDSDGTISADGTSVSFTAPTINSSAPSSAPFNFSVKNTGSIGQVLTVSKTGQTGNLTGKFSAIPATATPVVLAPNATSLVSTGIQWTELDNGDLGRTGSMTWTVSCSEYQAVTSAAQFVGPTGWYGWSCPAGTHIADANVTGGDYASLTLWKPGASVSGYSYPNTPFGYTYTPPEEGAIVQNDNDSGETQYLHLFCY